MSAQSMPEMMELDTELVYKVARIAEVPLGQPNSITRREWFMTHAPDAPPWFRYKVPDMPPNPPEPDPEKELNAAQQTELAAWIAGETTDFGGLSPAVRHFMLQWEKVQGMRKVFHVWQMKSREVKWWKWREYYADMMMKGE